MGFWTLQSLWAWVVLLPVTVSQALSPTFHKAPLGAVAKVGLAGFLIGWFWETAADYQKYVFKNIPENKDRWIDSGVFSLHWFSWKITLTRPEYVLCNTPGLFRYSRHPNYFGEILVWGSMLLLASTPLTRKKAWWIVISPIFVYLLLAYVSGIVTTSLCINLALKITL